MRVDVCAEVERRDRTRGHLSELVFPDHSLCLLPPVPDLVAAVARECRERWLERMRQEAAA